MYDALVFWSLLDIREEYSEDGGDTDTLKAMWESARAQVASMSREGGIVQSELVVTETILYPDFTEGGEKRVYKEREVVSALQDPDRCG